MKFSKTNRNYKDRLFKFIFGNPENKEWTLELYNAVNGSNYDNPDDIRFNTIDDVVYMGMRNGVWDYDKNPIRPNGTRNKPFMAFLFFEKVAQK